MNFMLCSFMITSTCLLFLSCSLICWSYTAFFFFFLHFQFFTFFNIICLDNLEILFCSYLSVICPFHRHFFSGFSECLDTMRKQLL